MGKRKNNGSETPFNSAGIRTYHTILPICVVVDFKSFLYKLNKQIIRNHCNLILAMEYDGREAIRAQCHTEIDGKNLLPKKNEHPIKISENRIFASLTTPEFRNTYTHTIILENEQSIPIGINIRFVHILGLFCNRWISSWNWWLWLRWRWWRRRRRCRQQQHQNRPHHHRRRHHHGVSIHIGNNIIEDVELMWTADVRVVENSMLLLLHITVITTYLSHNTNIGTHVSISVCIMIAEFQRNYLSRDDEYIYNVGP